MRIAQKLAVDLNYLCHSSRYLSSNNHQIAQPFQAKDESFHGSLTILVSIKKYVFHKIPPTKGGVLKNIMQFLINTPTVFP
ncbi:MAG: hypothetical protein RLZZ463_1348 [Bacteroidota bacterium]